MAKVLLVTPGAATRSQNVPALRAIVEVLGADIVDWTAGPWPSASGFDVVISFVKFRHLLRAESIDWGGFGGLRIHYDWDAFWDSHWSISPHKGEWVPTLRRHRFDLLITTGTRSQEVLQSKGLDVEVLPKAADPAVQDLGGPRPFLYGTYGQDYPSRLLMKAMLRRSGIAFDALNVPYMDLGKTLNRYHATLICTLDARFRIEPLGRRVYRWLPRQFIIPGDSPEPMGKFFEAAAAGTAPLVDWTPDLEALGFRDGETAIIYQTLDDLVDRASYFRQRPEDLRSIGLAAGRLVAAEHTWPNRARQLRQLIQRRLGSPTTTP